MRALASLAAVVFAIACQTPTGPLAPSAPAKPAVRTSGEDYRLPERIGEFQLQRFSDFPEPEAGFLAKYIGPDRAQLLDFFVYSARNLPAEISAADALWWEYEHTKHQLEASLPQRGWKVLLAREEILRVETKRGALDGVVARYQGEDRQNTPLVSLAFLALVGDDFVKMRATRVGAPDAAAERQLEDARRAFLAQIERRAPLAPIEYATIVSFSVDAEAGCSLIAKLTLTSVIERLLAQGHTLHTLAREVALLEGALLGFLEFGDAGEPCEDVALKDLEAVRDAGFLREYVWKFRKPSFWPDPGDLRREEFEKFWRNELKQRRPVEFGVNLQFKPPDAEQAGAAPPP